MRKYATEWVVEIEDISAFVAEQRANSITEKHAGLMTPLERPYRPTSESTVKRLGLD